MNNILRSKGNQAIKFGQLIEHNMRNIFFFLNLTQTNMKIPLPDSFLKKQN